MLGDFSFASGHGRVPYFHVLHLQPCREVCSRRERHDGYSTTRSQCTKAVIFARKTARHIMPAIRRGFAAAGGFGPRPKTVASLMLLADPPLTLLALPKAAFAQDLSLHRDDTSFRAVARALHQYECVEFSFKAVSLAVLAALALAALGVLAGFAASRSRPRRVGCPGTPGRVWFRRRRHFKRLLEDGKEPPEAAAEGGGAV